jgi:two-component system CheB/CheR fusion protein
MVEHLAPPSLLVGEDDRIAHYSAGAGRYLQLPGGDPTHGLYDLLREPAAGELRRLIAAARGRGRPAHSRPLTLATGGGPRRVVISVRPASDPELAGLLLVIFDEQDPAPEAPPKAEQDDPAAMDAVASQRVADLQATQQELLSANEELRAMVVELTSSQESLQSLNEELKTVNKESARRLAELDQVNADLRHFHAATRIPTLFLDRSLAIVRFTDQAARLFRLRPGDSGRPLTDLTNRLDYPELIDDARAVLGGREQVEREVAGPDGSWYLARTLPYRKGQDPEAEEKGAAEGVVITLVDISARRRAEQETLDALKARDYADGIIETIHEPLVVLGSDLVVKRVNQAFCDQFQVTLDDTLGRKIYDLGNRQWDIPALRRLLEEVLPDNETFDDYRVTHDFETIGRRVMLLNARRLKHVQLILLGIRDVTERHDAEEA